MPVLRTRHLVLAFVAGFLLVSAGALAAQDTHGADPTSPLGGLALALLLPVVAWVSAKLYDGIKTIIPAFDRLPALVHQVAAPAFQFLLGMVASATGAAVLTDIHAIDAAWIGGLLNMLLAAGIKRFEKSREPADATAILEKSRASAPWTGGTSRSAGGSGTPGPR